MHDNKIIPIFKTAETKKKGWGKEIWIDNNDEYCGKLLKFVKGAKFSSHFHFKKRETFYVLSGRIQLSYFDYTSATKINKILEEGDCVEIPRLVAHQIEAVEPTTIIEISTTHFEDDSYRVAKGDSQK